MVNSSRVIGYVVLRIAIIGGTGLLGSNLIKLFSGYDVKGFSRKNNIICFNNLEDTLSNYFDNWRPNIIINTVAIVNLQKCEDDLIYAEKVNYGIAISMAKIAKKYNSYFIHISTDHYFNDDKQIHSETDNVFCLNNYAKTKYQAEEVVVKLYDRSLVVRTNIIGYRRTAKSFFEWLLFSLQTEEKIELYSNFYTSPISVNMLGLILLRCYEKNLQGVYNISSKEVIDKYSFGIKVAEKFGYKTDNIRKTILRNEDNSLKRALTLGLDVSKIEKALELSMPTVDEVIEDLYQEYKDEHEQ